MSSVHQKNDAAINTQSGGNIRADKTSGKLFFYNGTHRMVFVDANNGNREYIFDENGKKMYLDEYAILQMKKDNEFQQQKLMSSFDSRIKNREKQKEIWFNKFKLENIKYDFFTAAKKTANKGYQSILSQTGCSSLSEVKEYSKTNGGDYFEKAKTFLAERSDARSAQIKSEAMSAFYGRMYVDESKNLSDIQCQKIVAKSIFENG